MSPLIYFALPARESSSATPAGCNHEWVTSSPTSPSLGLAGGRCRTHLAGAARPAAPGPPPRRPAPPCARPHGSGAARALGGGAPPGGREGHRHRRPRPSGTAGTALRGYGLERAEPSETQRGQTHGGQRCPGLH